MRLFHCAIHLQHLQETLKNCNHFHRSIEIFDTWKPFKTSLKLSKNLSIIVQLTQQHSLTNFHRIMQLNVKSISKHITDKGFREFDSKTFQLDFDHKRKLLIPTKQRAKLESKRVFNGIKSKCCKWNSAHKFIFVSECFEWFRSQSNCHMKGNSIFCNSY